jgi:outer membrane biosynthesis protein TonB
MIVAPLVIAAASLAITGGLWRAYEPYLKQPAEIIEVADKIAVPDVPKLPDIPQPVKDLLTTPQAKPAIVEPIKTDPPKPAEPVLHTAEPTKAPPAWTPPQNPPSQAAKKPQPKPQPPKVASSPQPKSAEPSFIDSVHAFLRGDWWR